MNYILRIDFRIALIFVLIFNYSLSKYFIEMKNALSICYLVLFGQVAFSQNPVFENGKGIALNGYDPVSYFTQHEAMRGSSEHQSKQGNLYFYFSTEENKTLFEENPETYLPQYGGFCAFAMANMGKAVPSDPTTFKLRDGKLYLFFNDFYEGKPFNTVIPWNANEKEMLAKANANWPKLGN